MPESLTPAGVPSSARLAWGAVNPNAEAAHRLAFRVFVVTTVLAGVAAVAGVRASSIGSWLYALHVVVALLTILIALARRLPVQNVAACGLALALTMGMALAMVGHELADAAAPPRTGAPANGLAGVHGAPQGSEGGDPIASKPGSRLGAGVQDLGWAAWPAPLLWTALLLAARQTAKVLVQPWRRQRQYGWWLLAVAAGLAWVALVVGGPFMDRVLGWWTWTPSAWSWYGMPLLWLGCTLLLIGGLLLLAGAWLVPKRRTGRPADFEPVWVWGGLVLWFVSGNLREGIWVAAGLGLAAVAIVTPLAWRAAQMPVMPGAGPGGQG